MEPACTATISYAIGCLFSSNTWRSHTLQKNYSPVDAIGTVTIHVENIRRSLCFSEGLHCTLLPPNAVALRRRARADRPLQERSGNRGITAGGAPVAKANHSCSHHNHHQVFRHEICSITQSNLCVIKAEIGRFNLWLLGSNRSKTSHGLMRCYVNLTCRINSPELSSLFRRQFCVLNCLNLPAHLRVFFKRRFLDGRWSTERLHHGYLALSDALVLHQPQEAGVWTQHLWKRHNCMPPFRFKQLSFTNPSCCLGTFGIELAAT